MKKFWHKHQSWARVVIVLLILLSVIINAVDEIQLRSVEDDARHNLAMAYNNFQYGVVSDLNLDSPDIPPTYRREPFYSLILTGVLQAIADPQTTTHDCLIEPEPACVPLQLKLQWFNLLWLLALTLTTFAAGRVILGDGFGPYFASLLVGFAPGLTEAISNFYTELTAALPLLILATCLFLCVTRRRWQLYAIVAGCAFAALMLTKAVFLYFGVILVFAFVAYAWQRHSWQPLKMAALILLVAYAIAGLWMTRNYLNFGAAKISGRGGEVLAIRAQFSEMSWTEYGAGWFAFTPGYGEPLLQRFFAPEDYARFDRGNPEGFYRSTKNRIEQMRPENIADRDYQQQELDDNLKEESIAKIKQNWVKHLALTATFAYRGSFIKMFAENSLVPVRLIYVISLFVVLYLALKYQDIGIAFFLLPSLYSYAIYAFASHYIPRFSAPLIPCLAIAFTLLLVRFSHLLQAKKRQKKLIKT
ncbi:MAG TPA: hypothetical protein V6C71_23485 [Coleofasciculaceae cyanobacterium]|jgi:4-amino-4-deoxy-L-arabinose transferase-like glycosyltransferase